LLNKTGGMLFSLLVTGLFADTSEVETNKTEKFNGARLSQVEVEVVDLFVQFSRALGQPRSVAEIYGLLFASHRPLSMDELIERLKLSKGSASQGLRYLLELGAVRMVYIAGERRKHYEAVAELRKLAGSFLRRQILTHFEDSETRLGRIAAEAHKLPEAERKHSLARVKTLRNWGRKGRRVLPFMLNILGGGK
jgi:HTH-type transcriptional regulator, glycine betaine synthesis regulator